MKVAFLLIICFLAHCQAYKILIFINGFSYSHVQFDLRLANMIAEKGHKVTVVIEEYNPLNHNLELSPGVNEIRIDPLKGGSINKGDLLKLMTDDIFEDKSQIWEILKNIKLWASAGDVFGTACENLVGDMKLIDQLKNVGYDLAVVDLLSYCSFGLIKILGIPSHIWMSSGLLIDLMASQMGAPNHPSYVPLVMSSYGDQMTFGQRFVNFLSFFAGQIFSHIMIGRANGIVRKFHGQDFLDLGQLAANSSLVFVNSEEFLDFPRPILHKIIYIGGLGLAKPQPLEPHWLKIMNDSKDGVVLFSFGSIANTTLMPQHWKDAFLTAFSKFPDVTFIWKFEGDLPKDKLPKNVVLSKWVPQVDLFGHPKMKAFITHSGFNSLLEASTNGIPIITIPLFADQFGNCKRAEKQGIAVTLEKRHINEKDVGEALEQILYNSSFKHSAERLSNLIRKKPVKNSELVVPWIEYVAENQGLPNLEPASVHMNWFVYLSLDIVAVLALINCLFLCLCYYVAKICINALFCPKSKTKVE